MLKNIYTECDLCKDNIKYGFYQSFKNTNNFLIKVLNKYNKILFDFIEFLEKETKNNIGWLLLTKEDKKNYKKFDFVFSFNDFLETNKFNISQGTIEGQIEFFYDKEMFTNYIFFDVKNSNISNVFFFDLIAIFFKKHQRYINF